MRAYKVFAVQWGGRCHSSPTAHLTYAIYGKSTACLNGRGNVGINDVYVFEDANLGSLFTTDNGSTFNLGGWTNVTSTLTWQQVPSNKLRILLGYNSSASSVPYGEKATQQKCFAYNSSEVMDIADIPSMMEATMCLWIYTTGPSLMIQYLAPTTREFAYMALRLGNKVLGSTVMGEARSINSSGAYGAWQHVCLLASFKTGTWVLYQDGVLTSSGYIKNPSTKTRGGGRVVIRQVLAPFNVSTRTESCIAGLNMWSKVHPEGEVVRMSHGCGDEAGDIMAWHKVVNTSNGDLGIGDSCRHRGARVMVTSSGAVGAAVMESPWYDRSRDWYGGCLKFRYLTNGTGNQFLRVSQRFRYNYTDRVLWASSDVMQGLWKYAQAPINVAAEYKILVHAESRDISTLFAIAGMFTTTDYCDYEPASAAQACNQSLSDSDAGYIVSPQYPSYYTNNTRCAWQIYSPPSHVVRVKILAFELEDHVTCARDYLEVHDGITSSSGSLIGRFCGTSYPQLIESTGNSLHLTFVSNSRIAKSGFKARYSFKKVNLQRRHDCIADCPSGCRCFLVPGETNDIIVEGIGLLDIPRAIPARTKVLRFLTSKIYRLQNGGLRDLASLAYVDISNNAILSVERASFRNLEAVISMRLNNNFIKQIEQGTFNGVKNIRVLDLGANLLAQISRGTFDGLDKLKVLSLRHNKITNIAVGAFNDTSALEFLYLQNNSIADLPAGTFQSLEKLRVLYLQNNKIAQISRATFRGLSSLRVLRLEGNLLAESNIPVDTFDELGNLEYLKLDSFTVCCYAKQAIAKLQSCVSPGNEFSSCADLMKNDGIRACVWVLGLLAFLGNLLVIIWRIVVGEDNRVQSVLLTNLAIADFQMGVYLLIIAVQDARWKGEYFKHDILWRSGSLCQIAGALSMLSSEVSVLMLAVITADRLVCIVFPFKVTRLGRGQAIFACAVVWVFGLLMSFLPMSGYKYFYDDAKGTTFFGRSSVCLPLQLSSDRPSGWEYSVALFIGLNFVAFLFILLSYVAIFVTVMRSTKGVRSTSQQRESSLAKRLMFIILTDFACWMPVIVIGILSLTGGFHDPQKQAYVWIAVFVLPVNSSINPILYTFSTKQVKSWARRKTKNKMQGMMYHRRLNDSSEAPSTLLSTAKLQCAADGRSYRNYAVELDATTEHRAARNNERKNSDWCDAICDDKGLEAQSFQGNTGNNQGTDQETIETKL